MVWQNTYTGCIEKYVRRVWNFELGLYTPRVIRRFFWSILLHSHLVIVQSLEATRYEWTSYLSDEIWVSKLPRGLELCTVTKREYKRIGQKKRLVAPKLSMFSFLTFYYRDKLQALFLKQPFSNVSTELNSKRPFKNNFLKIRWCPHADSILKSKRIVTIHSLIYSQISNFSSFLKSPIAIYL